MRSVTLEVGGRRYETNIDAPASLAVPLDFHGEQSRAFGLPAATAEPISFDSIPCDTRNGGDFNAESLSLVPHGNGTHTETVGHLVDHEVPVGECLAETLIPCTLLTVEPVRLGDVDESYPHRSQPDDLVLTRRDTDDRLAALEPPRGFSRAVILCTGRRDDSEHRDYSDTNPPYLTTELVDWLVERDVDHLLVDLPSLDREYEGGHLANHRRFWELPADASEQHPPSPRTVTEFVRVSRAHPDGVYFLDVELPNFRTDAAPSRPLLFEATALD